MHPVPWQLQTVLPCRACRFRKLYGRVTFQERDGNVDSVLQHVPLHDLTTTGNSQRAIVKVVIERSRQQVRIVDTGDRVNKAIDCRHHETIPNSCIG